MVLDGKVNAVVFSSGTGGTFAGMNKSGVSLIEDS